MSTFAGEFLMSRFERVKLSLTINLQRATLDDHKAALALNARAVFGPLDVGRRRAGGSARQHRDASLRQRLIRWSNLDDWGRNVVHRHDLRKEKSDSVRANI